MKNVFVVNTCDEWKGYDSFSLVGVFTSRTQLNKILQKLLNEKKITKYMPETIQESSLKGLQERIEFVHINFITINEEQ